MVDSTLDEVEGAIDSEDERELAALFNVSQVDLSRSVPSSTRTISATPQAPAPPEYIRDDIETCVRAKH